jgi:hypothetical protein
MFLRWGVVSTSPNPQARGPPLVGCLRLLIQYIHGCPPYWRLFLHTQPEDALCCGDGPTYHGNILFVCYLSFICCDDWWIGKDMEGGVCGLIWGTILAFVWKDWKLQNLIGMSDVCFGIQTRYRLNASVELQCHTKSLMCWNLIQHDSFMGIVKVKESRNRPGVAERVPGGLRLIHM